MKGHYLIIWLFLACTYGSYGQDEVGEVGEVAEVAEVEAGEKGEAPVPQVIGQSAEFAEREITYPKGNRVLELAGTGRCMTIGESFNIFLGKCNWKLDEPLVASVFKFIKSNRGGWMMRWRNHIPPGSIEGCLLDKIPKESVQVENSDEELRAGAELLNLANCDSRKDDQNWHFVKVEDGNYQIRKFPTGKCLGADESNLEMVECDKTDKTQLWNICRDLNERVCDN